MFSKKDYQGYLKEIDGILSKQVVLLTDVLNEVSDQAIYSRLYAIAEDDMRIFENVLEKMKD